MTESLPSGAPAPPSRTPRERLRRALLALAAILAVLLALVFALRVPAVGTPVANLVLGRLHALPGATLSVHEARGDWLTRLELRGLRLAGGGVTYLSVDHVRLRHDFWPLLRGRVHIREADLVGVRLDPRLLTVPRPPPARPARRLTLDDILRGRFYAGPRLEVGRLAVLDVRGTGTTGDSSLFAGVADSTVRLMSVRLDAHDIALGRGFAFMLDSLGVELRPRHGGRQHAALTARASLEDGRLELHELRFASATSDVRARGDLAYARADTLPGVWLALEASPLDLADVAAFAGLSDSGATSLQGLLRAQVDLRGRSLDRVSGRLHAGMDRGRIAGLGLSAARLECRMDQGRADGVLNTGVERAPVTVRGWMRPLDAHPAYELLGSASRLPERLAGATWWPAFAKRCPFAIEVSVKGHGFADMVAEVAGTARGEAGALELQSRIDRRSGLDWEVRRLALRDLDVARVAGLPTESRVRGVVSARGSTDRRGRPRATARLDLEISSYGRWTIESGRAAASLDERGGGASLSLESASGALTVDTLSWRLDGASPFRLRGARLRVGDLAGLSGVPAVNSALEASAELEGGGLASVLARGGGLEALRRGRLHARGHVLISPSRFRGRAVQGGRIDVSFRDGSLELEGGIGSDAGRLAVQADSRPFDAAPVHRLRRVRFEELDLGVWAGNAVLRSRLAGTLSGEAGGTSADLRWSARLILDRAFIGPLAFERGEWRAEGDGRAARLGGRLDVRGGAITLDGDLNGVGTESAVSARLELPFGVLPALLGRDSLSAAGSLQLTVEASGPLREPRSMRASGRVRGQGSIARAAVDSLELDFHLERGLLTLDTLALRSNVATARAHGRVALMDSPSGDRREAVTQLRAELELRDPSRLAPLLGADSLSVSSGSVRLEVSGRSGAQDFLLRSDLRSLVWDGLRVKRADATIRGSFGSAGRLSETNANAKAEGVVLGRLRVPTARLQVAGDAQLVRWSGDGRLRDRDSVWFAGDFRPDSSGWKLAIERLDLLADSSHWQLSRPATLVVHEQRFTLDRFESRSQRGHLLAHGVLDRAGSQDFHIELRDVGLGVLSSLGALGELRGGLNGALDITGPASSPRANGNLRATLATRAAPAGALGAEFDWTASGFDLSSSFSSPERDSIALTGHLPISFTLVPPEPGAPAKPRISGDHSQLRLRADRFPMLALQPLLVAAGVGAIDGMLDMDLRLSGQGRAFRGDGSMNVAGGRLELPGLGGKFSQLRMRAAWNGDRLVLQEFHTLAGKGRLEASGSLRMASLVRAEPDLTIRADRAVLADTKKLKVMASGDLHLGGALDAPVIAGRLRFGGCQLLLAQETFADPNAKAAISLSPEDLRTLEETFTYVEPVTPDPLLALYDASDLDVTLTLDRNNWIRQTAEPRLSVEVFGEVRMRKKPGGEPELVGRLEPLPGRGYVEQFGRSFALTGGEVLLNGAMSAHTLDVHAQYPSERDAMSREENDVIVRLDLQGTLEKMRLVLSSEPALTETEIITFIATGRSPTTRTGESQSVGSDAVSLGVDMGLAKVSGALEDAAKGSVGLDVLKVGYDGIQGTTLIAGRYVAPQLYVGFRQPLQTVNNSGTNLDEDTDTKVEMEYAAYRWLVLNVQGESSFIRSYLRFRREY